MENENKKYSQSAVIPYKFINGKLNILLIKSRNDKWIFPKGIIENGLSPQESARREAVEEAGANGNVDDKLLGEFDYEKWGGVCHVKVYSMKVEEEYDKWEEDYFRIKKWFSFDKALKKMRNESLVGIVKLLREHLSNNDQ